MSGVVDAQCNKHVSIPICNPSRHVDFILFFCMEEQIWFSFPLLQWVFTIRCTNSIRVHGSLLIGYSGIQTKLQHCITSISQLVSVKFFTPKYCRLNNTLTIYILVSCKCTINNPVYLYLSTCILLQYYSEKCWFWRKKFIGFLLYFIISRSTRLCQTDRHIMHLLPN